MRVPSSVSVDRAQPYARAWIGFIYNRSKYLVISYLINLSHLKYFDLKIHIRLN